MQGVMSCAMTCVCVCIANTEHCLMGWKIIYDGVTAVAV